MNTEKIKKILQNIIEKYRHMKYITETFGMEKDIEKFMEFLVKREILLSEVDKKRGILNGQYKFWRKLIKDDIEINRLCQDIRNLLTHIVATDHALIDKLKREVYKVKEEVSSLSSNSKAIYSYMRYNYNNT